MKETNLHLKGIPIYRPGEADRSENSTVIKLSSNENPYGTSSCVTSFLKNCLLNLERYPDGVATCLREDLSRHLSVNENQLIVGNGSNDLLELIAKAYLTFQDKVLSFQYSFIVYKIVSQLVGAEYIEVPVSDQFEMNVKDLLRYSEDVQLIFIASPNNPTGQILPYEQIVHLLNSVGSQTLVVVDEAYMEYAEKKGCCSLVSLVESYPSLIVLRTFSKIYGLASMRVGYAVAHPSIIEGLNSVRQPFNVGSLAQKMAQEALKDQHFVDDSIQKNNLVMDDICQKLTEYGRLEVYSSYANFILIKIDDLSNHFFEWMKQRGILVRPLAPYGLDSFVRVTIGTKDQMSQFLQNLGEWYEQLG